MINHRTAVLYACICVFSLNAAAQVQAVSLKQETPANTKVFQNLPERILLNIDNLQILMNTPVGKTISIDLSLDSKFQFDGQVVSVTSKENDNVQTIVVRSSNYRSARLILSKISSKDASASFGGRIISYQDDDMLELNNQDGQLMFLKRKYNDLVRE